MLCRLRKFRSKVLFRRRHQSEKSNTRQEKRERSVNPLSRILAKLSKFSWNSQQAKYFSLKPNLEPQLNNLCARISFRASIPFMFTTTSEHHTLSSRCRFLFFSSKQRAWQKSNYVEIIEKFIKLNTKICCRSE